MNMNSRSSSVLWCLETNSRIGLLDSTHRSSERSIHFSLNYSRDPLGVGAAFTHGPAHQRFGADYDHSGMVVSVRILLRVVVEKAKRLAQEQNIVRLPR